MSGEPRASVRYAAGNNACRGAIGVAATLRARFKGIGTWWAASTCTPWPLGPRSPFPLTSRINELAPYGSWQRDKHPCQVRFQPTRCSRPDTGREVRIARSHWCCFGARATHPASQVQGLPGGRLPGSLCQEAHPVYGIPECHQSHHTTAFWEGQQLTGDALCVVDCRGFGSAILLKSGKQNRWTWILSASPRVVIWN